MVSATDGFSADAAEDSPRNASEPPNSKGGASGNADSQRDNSSSFFDWVLMRRGRAEDDVPNRPETDLDRRSSDEARRMLGNLQNMAELRVVDVAVPRADMAMGPASMTRDELIDLFKRSGYSRLPVYGETNDDPLGLVHLKDLALSDAMTDPGKFDLSALLRPLLFVPPSMPVGALLQKMQTNRTHMAIVIDEYGGVDGLVTMEDLVEQIVGEIADEHDSDEDRMWHMESEGVYRALARAELEDFEQAAGLDLLPEDLAEDVDTLGGLIFMLAGRVPARGEVVRHPQGHEFEVLEADPRRIKRLRVRVHAPEQAAS